MGQADKLKKLTSSRSLSGNVNTKWCIQSLDTSGRNTDYQCDQQIYLSCVTDNPSREILTIIDTSKSAKRLIPRKSHALSATRKQFNVLPSKQPIPKQYASQFKVLSSLQTKHSSDLLKITDNSSLKELNAERLLSVTNSVHSSRVPSATQSNTKSDCQRLSETLNSIKLKPDYHTRSLSTSTDSRCDRSYSPLDKKISHEPCDSLESKLCSDCTEVKISNTQKRQSTPLPESRFYALAIQRYLVNVNEKDVEKLINEKKVKINPSQTLVQDNKMMTDDEYFDQLSSAFHTHPVTPYYFRDMTDFAEKYRQNKYPRLRLSDSQVPQSANPIFYKQIEKYDVAQNYKTMKRASTVKPNIVSIAPIFISPKKTSKTYRERYFMNYTPQLLSNGLQNRTRLNSNPNIITIGDDRQTKEHKSLIARRQTIQV
ncbi:unnamed protein product [Didymodactylos carnosus]|uniref:Uncharacterized protein n=1 Tax=Didymodactylos carnosus TaxID=1234261 RepID=A0A814GLS6_9BILA|nr:unnamed protein product [Didymodactylos carnosus]CAF1318001.1 unnamed protein product [Didymodactylos carnosus]CAF3769666.1 unnamed protein product [Didymodactylos carnosus]CAF4127367.1 unnamed protein product [Didymodactylos carnosus]